ncbi:delta-9 desaturase-like protein [Scenedesmus sp. NREL 46B-D3]|nr:delta-9 desaturase-like protein [Scenedesmus sp. NREL 46B-D3]
MLQPRQALRQRAAGQQKAASKPCLSIKTIRTRRVRCKATPSQQQATQQHEDELQVSRVSASGGSRKAFSQAFCKLAGIQVSPLQDITPEQLAAAPFARYTPPLCNIQVQQKRPYWHGRTWTDTDVGYLSFFAAMHAVALLGGPLTFSWDALQVMLAGYVVTGMLGVSMSYHRQLSHKSFRTPKWLEYFLAYCGALAFEGDPIEWAKNHTWHHQHSDTAADRHSPRDGLWHAHMGWLFDESLTNTRRDGLGNSKESLAAPWFVRESPGFYGWLRETYMYHMLGQMLLLLAWGGLPYFVWGFVVRVLFTMHMTWLVNSAVHVWGSKAYDTDDDSRNNALVALLVFGDGWHNNHHAFPSSAAHGLEWWQLDASYCIIRGLELAGLAWDVRRPSQAQKERLSLAGR